MPIKICIAGATGWTGSLVTKKILESNDFRLVGAIARKTKSKDIAEVLGLPASGIAVTDSLKDVLPKKPDVLIDFTKPDSVKARVLEALDHGVRVVIGTSGLNAADYSEIEELATKGSLGVIACGNFSITAALVKHFSLIAAKHLPSWEIIDYAHAEKVDAPSGTTRELAEKLAEVKKNHIERAISEIHGIKETRGGTIAGTQVHSVRLPSYVISFETIFGLPNERLTLRHDSGNGADPYVGGTMLAAKMVMDIRGLVRGMDNLLFGQR